MNSIIPTNFNNGVKRLFVSGTLGGAHRLMGSLGDVSDDINAMEAEGYDPGILNSLALMGASDAQLQYLWDNFGAGTEEFSDAAESLMLQLTSYGTPQAPMQTSLPGAAYGAAAASVNAVINFGSTTLDLTQDAAWNFLSQQFSNTQVALNALAKQFPGDQTVIQQIGQFNSLVLQFSSYWQQVYGSSLSSIPMASLGGVRGLGALGIAPLVIAGIVAAVALMAAGLYAIIQWIAVKKTQATTAQTQAIAASSTAATLTSSYAGYTQQAAAARAAGNPQLAASLDAQANAALVALNNATGLTASTPASFAAWFQQNWGWLMIGLGAIVIVPAVVKKF
jgi:hypothetical protein